MKRRLGKWFKRLKNTKMTVEKCSKPQDNFKGEKERVNLQQIAEMEKQLKNKASRNSNKVL